METRIRDKRELDHHMWPQEYDRRSVLRLDKSNKINRIPSWRAYRAEIPPDESTVMALNCIS